MACLLNHSLYPSRHPPIYLSIHPAIYSSSTSSSSVVCRLEGQPPCSDTLTHTQTYTSAMCHYQFHLPLPVIPRLPVHLPTLALHPPPPFFFFALSQSFSPPLLVLNPPYAVCHRCREEKKNAPSDESERSEDKTQKRVKEEKVVRAGACLERSDASIHHEPDSSLMEYPGRRQGRGKEESKKKKKK